MCGNSSSRRDREVWCLRQRHTRKWRKFGKSEIAIIIVGEETKMWRIDPLQTTWIQIFTIVRTSTHQNWKNVSGHKFFMIPPHSYPDTMLKASNEYEFNKMLVSFPLLHIIWTSFTQPHLPTHKARIVPRKVLCVISLLQSHDRTFAGWLDAQHRTATENFEYCCRREINNLVVAMACVCKGVSRCEQCGGAQSS